jgi:UDP-N-acetylmuramoyl-L-alanyl-D-glutamate--2,6-diaminopimelate ligase
MTSRRRGRSHVDLMWPGGRPHTVMVCGASAVRPSLAAVGTQDPKRGVSSTSIPNVDACSLVPITDRSHVPAAPRPAPPAPLRLEAIAELTSGELLTPTAATQTVSDVTHDSRQAGPGVLFACRPGVLADGHDFAATAVERGSPALLVERHVDLPVPQIRVDSVAQRLGAVAAAVHGDPSRDLLVAGVTGTNGKTTCATLLDAVFARAGMRTALIGTVVTRIGDHEIPGVRTTPEATDLQRLYRRMLEDGVRAVALEVSSHGLSLGRVNGTRFRVALFTNLTHDHLDFHGSMESYFAAKARLFTPEFSSAGIVNVDDPWGARLAEQATVPVTTVSSGAVGSADIVVTDVSADAKGSRVAVRMRSTPLQLDVGMAGAFNIANSLLVLAASDVLGLDRAVVVETLRHPPAVPGRMERIDEGQPFAVLVDYAHSPDSLARVLAAAREIVTGRVIVVIGCGGDRDREKRPEMGAAAATGADYAIFTNDNPRSEDPARILDAIVAGARSVTGGRWAVEPDRRTAIGAALAAAEPGDAVVIAGKGHETGQQLADRTVPFDDRRVTRALLRKEAI